MQTLQKLVFCPCKIKPLEDLGGVITSVNISSHGIEYKVRYYLDGKQNNDWFQDFEIIITGEPKSE